MNELPGVTGLPPVLLVFGSGSRAKAAGLDFALPRNDARLKAMATARTAYRQIVNQQRIQRLLRTQVAPSADRTFQVGDNVYVWREKTGQTGEYKGPYDILAITGMQLNLADREGSRTGWFSPDQCRPAPAPPADAFATDLGALLSQYRSIPARERRAATRQRHHHPGDFEAGVQVTEVLQPTDPRSSSPAAQAAVEKELRGLIERGTFRVVLRQEMTKGKKPLTGKMVLAIKALGEPEEKYKGRFVVRGFGDPAKQNMLHNSPNLRPESIRLLLALASILGFRVWTIDITQAFLQAAAENLRDIYLEGGEHSAELDLSADEVLQLMRPLYGLADAGDRWHHTLAHHHLSDLNMESLVSERSLYYKMIGSRLAGLSGVYVDDILRCGTPEFQDAVSVTAEKFDATPAKVDAAKFAGLEFERDENGEIRVHMDGYIRDVKLATEISYRAFASNRAKLAWLVYARPDICAVTAKLAQVTAGMFAEDADAYCRIVTDTLEYLRRRPLAMIYPRLDKETLYVRAYSDASHAGNADGSSQIATMVFLVDGDGRACPIAYRSHKASRVCRSAMAAEAIALGEAFDSGFVLRVELERLLQRPVRLELLTDSQQVFSAIANSRRTTERRTMLDLDAATEGFDRGDVTNLGLVRSEHMLADALTKVMDPHVLCATIMQGRIDHPIERWVIRDRPHARVHSDAKSME